MKVDSTGSAIHVSPFDVKIPDVPRMGIWSRSVALADDQRKAAWLDTLKLVQLRALQGRLRAYGRSIDERRRREGGNPRLDEACDQIDHDSQLVCDAVGRWADRNP